MLSVVAGAGAEAARVVAIVTTALVTTALVLILSFAP